MANQTKLIIKTATVVAAVLLGTAPPADAADLTGTLHRVIDGDTFDSRISDGITAHIRLCGIDAPERGSPRYEQASFALKQDLEYGPITCRPVGEGTVCDGRSPRISHDRIVGAGHRRLFRDGVTATNLI